MTIYRSAIRLAFLILAVSPCAPTGAQEFLPSWQTSPAPAYSPQYAPPAPAYPMQYAPLTSEYPQQYAPPAPAYPTHYSPPAPGYPQHYSPSTPVHPTHFAPPPPAYPLPYAEPAPAFPLPYAEPAPEPALGKQTCDSSCSACPRAYAYAEFLFLQRSNCSDNQPIIESFGGWGTETFFSTSDLNFDFEPAFRGVVGYRLHDGWALEASYLGLFDATSRAFLVPPDGNTQLSFPDELGFGGNVFNDMDRIWIDYSSEIHSGELNLVCCTGCCTTCDGKGSHDPKQQGGCCDIRCRTFEWFVGFRYLSVAEQLRIYAERDLEITGGGFGTESGHYDISARNNLFGPQIGARVRRWDNRLGWEATGKVGVFYNDAQQRQEIIDFPDFELRSRTGGSGGQIAYMGEFNLTGFFRLNDVWNLRAGYNVMWIGGLALAPDQLDFTDDFESGQRLDRTGGIFLHGVSLGIEARW